MNKANYLKIVLLALRFLGMQLLSRVYMHVKDDIAITEYENTTN